MVDHVTRRPKEAQVRRIPEREDSVIVSCRHTKKNYKVKPTRDLVKVVYLYTRVMIELC